MPIPGVGERRTCGCQPRSPSQHLEAISQATTQTVVKQGMSTRAKINQNAYPESNNTHTSIQCSSGRLTHQGTHGTHHNGSMEEQKIGRRNGVKENRERKIKQRRGTKGSLMIVCHELRTVFFLTQLSTFET